MSKKKPLQADLLVELADIKLQAARLAAREKQVKKDILAQLKQSKFKSTSVTMGLGTFKATLVEPETVVIDPERLKLKVGAQLWEKITVRVLDTGKLDEVVASGQITKVQVADCSEIKASEPYIRTSGTYTPEDISDYRKQN